MSVYIGIFKHTHNDPLFKTAGTRYVSELIIFHVLKIQYNAYAICHITPPDYQCCLGQHPLFKYIHISTLKCMIFHIV